MFFKSNRGFTRGQRGGFHNQKRGREGILGFSPNDTREVGRFVTPHQNFETREGVILGGMNHVAQPYFPSEPEFKRRRMDDKPGPYQNRRFEDSKYSGRNVEIYDPTNPTGIESNYDRQQHFATKQRQVALDAKMRFAASKNTPPRPDREYCKTCSKWFNGTFQLHRISKQHQNILNRQPNKPPPRVQKSDHPPIKKPLAIKPPEPTKPDDIIIPDYDEKKIYGKEFVIAVSGFFCQLCHKFYNVEALAFDTHCKSRAHYDKVVNVLEEKRRALSEKLSSFTGDVGNEEEESEVDSASSTTTTQKNNSAVASSASEQPDSQEISSSEIKLDNEDVAEDVPTSSLPKTGRGGKPPFRGTRVFVRGNRR